VVYEIEDRARIHFSNDIDIEFDKNNDALLENHTLQGWVQKDKITEIKKEPSFEIFSAMINTTKEHLPFLVPIFDMVLGSNSSHGAVHGYV
jgi:hypothetical protein